MNILAFVITAMLGEWLCLRREMQDIPMGKVSSATESFLQDTISYAPLGLVQQGQQRHVDHLGCQCSLQLQAFHSFNVELALMPAHLHL